MQKSINFSDMVFMSRKRMLFRSCSPSRIFVNYWTATDIDSVLLVLITEDGRNTANRKNVGMPDYPVYYRSLGTDSTHSQKYSNEIYSRENSRVNLKRYKWCLTNFCPKSLLKFTAWNLYSERRETMSETCLLIVHFSDCWTGIFEKTFFFGWSEWNADFDR